MNDAAARRILLALTDNFDLVAAVTACVARGVPVQEDFGFTPAEVKQARKDRATIARRYGELKQSRSFLAASVAARLEFLTGVEGEEGGQES